MKPTIPEVLPRLQEYCWSSSGLGGSLHIVLEDCNVNDSHVQYCIDYAESIDDTEGAELGRILLKMSKTQRLKLANLW